MEWTWFDDGIEGLMVYTIDEKQYICGPLDEETCDQIVSDHNEMLKRKGK